MPRHRHDNKKKKRYHNVMDRQTRQYVLPYLAELMHSKETLFAVILLQRAISTNDVEQTDILKILIKLR